MHCWTYWNPHITLQEHLWVIQTCFKHKVPKRIDYVVSSTPPPIGCHWNTSDNLVFQTHWGLCSLVQALCSFLQQLFQIAIWSESGDLAYLLCNYTKRIKGLMIPVTKDIYIHFFSYSPVQQHASTLSRVGKKGVSIGNCPPCKYIRNDWILLKGIQVLNNLFYRSHRSRVSLSIFVVPAVSVGLNRWSYSRWLCEMCCNSNAQSHLRQA